jgi:glutaredoxin 3
MKAVIWSKFMCPYCDQAKSLLASKGYEIEERKIGDGYLKEDLLEAVPGARSVPQIFLDGELIGGLDNLKAHFESQRKPKIYESPDKGKTIYERDFGSLERTLVRNG